MYEFDSRVRFSEVANNGHMTLLGVLNYFQDCSTFQSEDLGVGIDYYKEQGTAWVVNSWQIDLYKLPKLGDYITIGTVPYKLHGFLGHRNFYMKDKENGEYLACANSIWTYIDLQKIKPVRAEEKVLNAYQIGEPIDMNYAEKGKLTMDVESSVVCDSITVSDIHLDTNNHVNNGKYVEMALHFVPEGFEIKRFRAEYIKSAVLNDVLVPRVCITDNEAYVFLQDLEGKDYVRMAFYKTI